ncbi:hypothetical protein CKM354_000726800 [Cercospora kikuchii]|uniref:Uncharacterized protein n=1 Tax=Cercospora kikuchii TaxID=84275 RepID=A0A9P3CJM8_9PEZI|nr:uncharacterized protein CKM354_000726800 [Cercospora kikuchii]GIZ44059.1 hypothetical protein CKM354_000726800 [Cercospora kikuchii]
MASQRSSARSRKSLYLAPLPNDGAEDTLQVPGASRPSISTSRRPSASGRSHRSHSTTLTVEDANKLMAEALAIQEQHDLPACGASRKSSIRPDTSDEDGNRRLSVRPEAHYATASNYSRSRRSLSVVAEDPSLLFARALKDHQQSKDLFRSESKRKEKEEQRLSADVISSDPSLDPPQPLERKASSLPHHHRRRTTIHTTLPSWTRFPSHTRALRSASATDPGIIIRDFADPSFRRNATANISQFPQQTYRETLKHLAKNCTSVAKYYATRLTSPEGYRGVNRRTSVSVAKGGVREPELEMISLSPGAVSSGIGEGGEGGEVGGGGMEVGREEHRLLLERVERELSEDDEEKVDWDRGKGKEKEKVKLKDRPLGLKLDLSRARSGTGLTRADSGFEGLEGARPGTPFVVEQAGFDWGNGFGGGGEKKEKRSGTFEFSFQQSSRRKQDGVGPKAGSAGLSDEDEEEQSP